MTMKSIYGILTIVCLSLVGSTSAFAQLAGQRINPNVVVLLDTGRGMNWTKIEDNSDNPESDRRTVLAEELCTSMNGEATPTEKTTAWQMVLEGMLGEVPQKYQHCFYEDASLRPLVTEEYADLVGESNIDDLTSEYWQFSREPHFRLVNCYDPRNENGEGRGMWNTDYEQCIGDLPSGTTGREIQTTPGGKTYWCEHTNIVTLGDREICLNYHPLSMDRQTNGLLERYRTLARFSLMTFDNLPAPTQMESASWDLVDKHRAGWDYMNDIPWYITAYEQRLPGDTSYLEPVASGSPYRYWNAGARSSQIEAIGRMVPISDDFEASNEDFRSVLYSVEPNHCSFDAAMFDDAGEYLYHSFSTRPMYNGGTDLFFNCRPKVVFFVTDGIQTDALEFPQAYCDKKKDGDPGTSLKPPSPWVDVDDTLVYNCPFNSTQEEVKQLFEVVKQQLVSGVSEPTVEPMYLVVIGLNMKDKDPSGSSDRCDKDPTWESGFGGAGYCKPPADDCIVLKELGQTDCENFSEASNAYADQVFVTPRQYLNMLALEGWPVTTSVYTAKPDDGSAGGRFIQPPWRVDNAGSYLWCSEEENNCGGEHDDADNTQYGALFVDSQEELTRVMEYALQAISPDTVSTRTELVTAGNPDATVSVKTAAAQFVFNSGYRTSSGGEPWQGLLYRTGQECTYDDTADDDTDDSSGGYNDDAFLAYHAELKTQAAADGRRLYVLNPSLAYSDFQYAGDLAYQEGLYGMLIPFDAATDGLTDCDLNVTDDSSCAENGYVMEVAEHLYGRDYDRAETPLGDIYNSTPYVLPRPAEAIPLDSYKGFRENKGWTDQRVELSAATPNTKYMYERQPLLFVGTNDGILHSFNVMSKMAGKETLEPEGWGYIPSPLLTTIGTQFPVQVQRKYTADTSGGTPLYAESYEAVTVEDGGHQHLFGVDAPPVAADVLLYKSNNADEHKYWRSIVIGGLGKGGYGYYALDVTKGPEHEPVFRWELSPSNYAMNAPLTPDANEDLTGLTEGTDEYTEAETLKTTRETARAAFSAMGMGLTRPALSYVYLNGLPPDTSVTNAKPHQVAVAILPGGYKTNESGGMEISTGVYIVRIADGMLIRYLSPATESDVEDPYNLLESPLFKADTSEEEIAMARTAQLVGQPIVPNGIITGKVNDEAFIGDDRGRIWRIDMSDEDPTEWKLELYFDTLLTVHHPYQDCLSTSSDYVGNSDCCTAKAATPAQECGEDDKEGFFIARTKPADYPIDACYGESCKNTDYPFPRVPMLAPPSIVQDDERNNVLLFGTGQIDGLESLDHHRVFSITVKPNITVSVDDNGTTGDESDDKKTSSMTRDRPVLNWWIGESIPTTTPLAIAGTSGLKTIEDAMLSDSPVTEASASGQASINGYNYFGLGEKLLGRIHVFRENAYFATFTPLSGANLSDACSDGGSKVWGVKFNELNDDAGVRDFDQIPDPDTGDLVPFIVYPGEVLTGLRVVRKPSCGGVEGFELMVQRASATAVADSAANNAAAPPAIVTQSIDLPQPQGGFTRVGIDSWSIVMGGSVQ